MREWQWRLLFTILGGANLGMLVGAAWTGDSVSAFLSGVMLVVATLFATGVVR